MLAWVPTGAKTGVSNSPWGVVRTAARARPLVAAIENSNIRADYKRAKAGYPRLAVL